MMFTNSKVLIFAALTGFLGSEAKFLAPRRVARGNRRVARGNATAKATAKAAKAAGKTAGKTPAKAAAKSAAESAKKAEEAAKRAELARRAEQRRINIAKTNATMKEENLQVVQNPGAGHCQYYSFKQALKLEESVDELRQIVVREAPTLLQDKGADYVNETVRAARLGIHRNACDSSCWGNDGSLYVLASVFGVHVRVLASDEGSDVTIAENDADVTRPVIFFRLQGRHYEWLSKKGMVSATPIVRSYQQYKDQDGNADKKDFLEQCEAIMSNLGGGKAECMQLLATKNGDAAQALAEVYSMMAPVETSDASASDQSDAETSDVPSVTSEEDYFAICKALGKSQKTCRQCLMETAGNTELALALVGAA